MSEIRLIPEGDRPREKMVRVGAHSLSDAELLAVILGRGVIGKDVMTLARESLSVIDLRNGSLTVSDLTSIHGMGSAKAAVIAASLEFARRRIRPEGIRIREARDFFPLVRHLADRKQEHFICASLNGAHEVIKTRVVTVGLLNSSQVHPREVFADPIADRAATIIVAHNHPSGDLTPSEEDIRVTRKLREAGEILGIKLLDHLIFGMRGFTSLQEAGLC